MYRKKKTEVKPKKRKKKMEKYYAQDFKNNKQSELFNTKEEAVKAAQEFNKQGGFALPMHKTIEK